MSIDEEDLPVIIDDVDPDDEEGEQIEKVVKRVQKYIKQHKVTPKTYTKRKQKALKELKKLVGSRRPSIAFRGLFGGMRRSLGSSANMRRCVRGF